MYRGGGSRIRPKKIRKMPSGRYRYKNLLFQPILRAMGFLASQHGQLGAIPPPPFPSVSLLESMRSGGAIPPHKRGISAILARYPMKTMQKRAIPPLRYYLERYCAIWAGISHWAAKAFLCFCGKRQGKPPTKTRIFDPYRTPKIPGEEGEKANKNREFLARRRKQRRFFRKRKGRTGKLGVVCSTFRLGINSHVFWC